MLKVFFFYFARIEKISRGKKTHIYAQSFIVKTNLHGVVRKKYLLRYRQ